MPGVILFLIVFVSVAVLAWCNSATYDKIQAINAENTQKARQNVYRTQKSLKKFQALRRTELLKTYTKAPTAENALATAFLLHRRATAERWKLWSA